MFRNLILAAFAIVASVVDSDSTSGQSQPASQRQEMTAKERLEACARKYAEAKTYRDEGEVVIEMRTDRPISSSKPFTTAFERDGRFHWEFKDSVTPGGKPTERYAVWSEDQKVFHSYWTLSGQKSTHEGMLMALAGPTGVSGGSTLAIIPLLDSSLESMRITALIDAKESGTEKVDGHDCVKIEGDGPMGKTTLWMDSTHAIRKMHMVQEIDPSKIPAPPGRELPRMEKFTSFTTITIKPVFDEAIEDDRFAPPAADQ